jgi:hypothetical protein
VSVALVAPVAVATEPWRAAVAVGADQAVGRLPSTRESSAVEPELPLVRSMLAVLMAWLAALPLVEIPVEVQVQRVRAPDGSTSSMIY